MKASEGIVSVAALIAALSLAAMSAAVCYLIWRLM